MNIGLKEGVGVVAGVVVGKYIFKSNNLLILTAMGVAGGVMAYYLIKSKSDSSKSDKYVTNVEEEMEESEEESNFYGTNREMEFNKTLGYHTPNGQMTEQEPRDYMDINF